MRHNKSNLVILNNYFLDFSKLGITRNGFEAFFGTKVEFVRYIQPLTNTQEGERTGWFGFTNYSTSGDFTTAFRLLNTNKWGPTSTQCFLNPSSLCIFAQKTLWRWWAIDLEILVKLQFNWALRFTMLWKASYRIHQ
jgi:hypothetical protein